MKSISMNTALLTEKWKFNVIKRKLILQIKTRTDIVVEAEEENVYQNV